MNHANALLMDVDRSGAPIRRALSVCLAYGLPHPSPAAHLARSGLE
jgi:hypothetical protein